MKTIGILTYHRSINYGAFLQSYALSTRLRQTTGCAVEIIDYLAPSIHRHYLHDIFFNHMRDVPGIYKKWVRYRVFRRSLCRLPLSKPYLMTPDDEEVFAYLRGRYDVVIVGSDAVWNWNLRGFPNPYLLHADLGCAKMSYAASAHGLDFSRVTAEQAAYLRESFLQYAFLGIRDDETARFVQGLDSALTVHHTCDPTVLLEMDADTTALRARLARRYGLDLTKPTIGIMSDNAELGRRVRARYGADYQLVALYVNNPAADYYLYDLNPFEWAQTFSCFRLLFTQYFHGMLLSLKNQTPIVAIDYWGFSERYAGKMRDLLTRIGLLEHYFLGTRMTEADWTRAFTLADGQLAEPARAQISAALTREAESFTAFQEALDRLLQAPAGTAR